MKHYAVIGHPVKHSLSPQIHHAFADQFNIDLSYQKIDSGLDCFPQCITDFISNQGLGANITLPFKEQAAALASIKSERVKLTGAANTLSFIDGEIHGENTDGIGLCHDIKHNIKFDISHKNILIIGAGGAVRGVIPSLLDNLPASITIANRTAAKAHHLADMFKSFTNIPLHSSGLNEVNQPYDIIINGTSSSVSGEHPDISPIIFDDCQLAYDMMYGQSRTVFENWALQHQVIKVHGGIGMLIEQAAAAFNIWHGKRPATEFIFQLLTKK